MNAKKAALAAFFIGRMGVPRYDVLVVSGSDHL
jgi:hypothetical protein